jgi:hypothetical protein
LASFVSNDAAVLHDEIIEPLFGPKFNHELMRALWERSDLPFPHKMTQFFADLRGNKHDRLSRIDRGLPAV